MKINSAFKGKSNWFGSIVNGISVPTQKGEQTVPKLALGFANWTLYNTLYDIVDCWQLPENIVVTEIVYTLSDIFI